MTITLKNGCEIVCGHAYACSRYGYVAFVNLSYISGELPSTGVRISGTKNNKTYGDGSGYVNFSLVQRVVMTGSEFCS